MTREEFYKLTDILNSEVLGNFMHGGEASEVIAQFEEAVEKSGILKEEPVSEDLEKEIEQYCIHHGYLDSFKDCGYTFNEQVGDIARHFADWQKQRDNIPQELVDAYWEFQKVANKNVRNYINIVNGYNKEPVSEDLAELINTLSKRYPEISFAKLSRIAVRVSRWQQNQDVKNKLPKVTNRTDLDEYAYQCAYDMSNDWAKENPTWHDVEDACKLGANWQKQQDQSTIELAEDHALLAGMEKMKEEMMEKAVIMEAHEEYGELWGDIRRCNTEKGKRYKVIIIKED